MTFRFCSHSLLHHSEKSFANGFCVSAIESENVFIQVVLKVSALKASLECSQDQPLDQRGN